MMITTDGCCGSQLVVGWKQPPRDPFMRTVVASAPPPLPPPPPATPAPPLPPEQPTVHVHSSPPPPSKATPQQVCLDLPWTAFVSPAAHLPNFRCTAEGKARFTANEWSALESFVGWLGGLTWERLAREQWTEWPYQPSGKSVDADREAGLVNYLRGLCMAPCLRYLLDGSLEPSGSDAAVTIDVGAFALEVTAEHGAVRGVSLLHETGHRQSLPASSPKARPEAARAPHHSGCAREQGCTGVSSTRDVVSLRLRVLSEHRLAVEIELT